MAHGLSCLAVCGIFPDQGLKPCPLHGQADSLPLSHQGHSPLILIKDKFFALYKVKRHLAPDHLSYLVFHIPPSTRPQALSVCLSLSHTHTHHPHPHPQTPTSTPTHTHIHPPIHIHTHTHTHTHTPCSLPGGCTGLFLRHLLLPPLHLLFPGKPFLTCFCLLSPTLPWVSISLSPPWGNPCLILKPFTSD